MMKRETPQDRELVSNEQARRKQAVESGAACRLGKKFATPNFFFSAPLRPVTPSTPCIRQSASRFICFNHIAIYWINPRLDSGTLKLYMASLLDFKIFRVLFATHFSLLLP
jgi:hypothetical protein